MSNLTVFSFKYQYEGEEIQIDQFVSVKEARHYLLQQGKSLDKKLVLFEEIDEIEFARLSVLIPLRELILNQQLSMREIQEFVAA